MYVKMGRRGKMIIKSSSNSGVSRTRFTVVGNEERAWRWARTRQERNTYYSWLMKLRNKEA
jgi:hypothetical protein